jgi:carbon monoxide dehydrogenase subunit G
MRIIRFIIFLLAVFIVIFLISLLLPSKVTVSKSVDINAPKEAVFNQIVNFEEWKNWYPAFKDENISIIKNPPAANTLASVTLKDTNGKSVTLLLVDTSEQTINIDLQSASSTKVNYQFILTPKVNNQTLLTWNVNTNLGWLPWKKMEGILLDKFSGDQCETALENLKKAAENH